MAVTLLLAAIVVPAGCKKAEPETPVPGAIAPVPTGGTEIAQKFCPVMGGRPIDPDIYVDHEGRRVYFCCQMCVDTFKAEPEKYLKKLDEELAGAEVPKPE